MATDIKYIAPSDLDVNQKIGVAYPLTGINGKLFSSNSITSEQIKTDLIMLLMTTKGERYMLPDYGTNYKKSLFENDEDAILEILDSETNIAVSKWLPIVIIKDIQVRRDDVNEHTFFLKVTYTTQLDQTKEDDLIISINPNTVITT